MFFTSEDDDSVDFIDLEKVREGWSETQPEESAQVIVSTAPQVSQIQWETEVLERFENVRIGICDYLPDYVETFDVLFTSLKEDLNVWLGIEPSVAEDSEQSLDSELAAEFELESDEVFNEVPDEDPAETPDEVPDEAEPEPVDRAQLAEQAGLAFEKGLMELENFLEAIFVDGDFWRLMR